MKYYQELLNECIDISEHKETLRKMQVDLIEMKANLNILRRRI